MQTQSQRVNYGIDAPGLVKTFFILAAGAGGVAVLIGFTSWLPARAGKVTAWLAGVVALYALAMGCYMLYGSLVGKVRGRERLLDRVPWSGGETVLDVGCGRGLLLIAAAKRATHGRAIGIDLWQAADQSGNTPEATRGNAAAEGVADRVEVQTGDARRLTFADASFDVVVSHWVIHNLYAPADREQALVEIVRVLRPGGWVVLADIAHHAEYVATLRKLGLVDVVHIRSRLADALRTAITFGSFRPGAVVGRKML